jgi:hypothetical protein
MVEVCIIIIVTLTPIAGNNSTIIQAYSLDFITANAKVIDGEYC